MTVPNHSSADQPARGRLVPWLKMLRPPNLFTVPGDALVGFVLAGGPAGGGYWPLTAVGCAVASMCLYCAGLLANDCFDLAEDKRDRPQRPLPAGQVRVRSAAIAAGVLAVAGVALATALSAHAGMAAGALAAAVLVYNAGAKRLVAVGPLVMGLCRSLSVLVGAYAAAPATLAHISAEIAAVIIGLYIATVTVIAARETRRGRVGVVRFGPAFVLGGFLATYCAMALGELLLGTSCWLIVLFLGLIAFVWSWKCGRRLAGHCEPKHVQQTVGMFIRGLLPLQATLIALAGCDESMDGTYRIWLAVTAGALVMLWPVSAATGKRFYAS